MKEQQSDDQLKSFAGLWQMIENLSALCPQCSPGPDAQTLLQTKLWE